MPKASTLDSIVHSCALPFIQMLLYVTDALGAHSTHKHPKKYPFIFSLSYKSWWCTSQWLHAKFFVKQQRFRKGTGQPKKKIGEKKFTNLMNAALTKNHRFILWKYTPPKPSMLTSTMVWPLWHSVVVNFVIYWCEIHRHLHSHTDILVRNNDMFQIEWK